MSVERSLSRSLPFLPRYHSVSSTQSSRRLPAMMRSRSQPSQRISYFQGTVNKFLTHSRPSQSPSPHRVYLLCPGKKSKGPLTRLSRSKSYSDLYASHVYTSLECIVSENEHPDIEVDARATSCGDIYHKGPFFPDVTQSESGISVGESEDGSLYGGDDDNASQISYGSSSAFHEITIDSELDRLDLEDGLRSPREPYFWYRSRGPLSPDSDRNSPFPYADSRKRELMSSPFRELERTHYKSNNNMLQVLIPTPDGSMAKERLTRKDSSGASTPLAQSTPHDSPRSFMGPKLSIAGCWNADDPYDGDESHNDSKATTKVDDSSCYSSVSEDNLSDVSPSKHKSTRKVKLTKKNSDLPAKRSNPKLFVLRGGQQKESVVSEESLANIYIPPLESVIVEDCTGSSKSNESEGGPSWWAVYNIGAADARREEEKLQKRSPTQEDDSKPEIKIVKPVKTGIPLISAGKHGKEKLKRYSQSSPPPRNGILSPKSSSPSPSDQSDYDSQIEDVLGNENDGVQEKTPLLKLDCKERAEDVLRKATQNLKISGLGAFGVVRASNNEEKSSTVSSALDNLRNLARVEETSAVIMINDKEGKVSNNEKESSSSEVDANNQGAQFMKDKVNIDSTSLSYLPCVSTLSFEMKEKKNEDVENKYLLEDTSLDNNSSQVLKHQIVTTESSQYSIITSAADIQPLNWDLSLSDQSPVQLSKQTPLDRNDVNYKDDLSDSPEVADSHHYLLGNSDTKGQAEETPAIFADLRLPGEENTQLREQKIVEVGGSRRGVSTLGLQEESALTSYTPGIGEDNNNSFSSHSSISVETPLQRADEILLSETSSTISSKDSFEKEFEALCSALANTLKISDPNETLVDEKESEEDASTESQIEEIKQVPVSLVSNVTTETKESTDQHADLTLRTDPTELDETLLSSPVFDDKIAAINEFEFLSGNVGREESKQTSLLNHEALSKSSFDDDQPEADTNMEWRFIDPRLLHGVGKSHEEGRRGDEEEAMEEGFDSPLVVRIIATAELPPTHTVDKNQQRINYIQPINVSQDDDSLTHNGLPPNYHSSHQELANTDQHYMLSSGVPINGIQSYDSSQNNVILHPTNDLTPLKMRESWEIIDGKINPNGSIKCQSEEGDLGGDKGIPRDEKSNAQNKDGASRQCGDEHEFLTGHSTNGPATESRAETASTALSQQVKHIHRKTVEETVTIERSSFTRCSSDKNHSESDGNIKDCDHCVEFVKNRKETVIHEEDKIFTTVGSVSYAVAPKHDENVSSENASFTLNNPNSSVFDLTHSTHDPAFNQKDPAHSNASLPPSSPYPESIIIADTNLSTQSAPPRPPPPSDASISQFNSESTELHASTMKWRDSQTIPPTQTPFGPNVDPSNRVTDVQDNSMVIGAEHSVMKHSSTPVTHHGVLDHLQAQLSHISGHGIDVATTPFLHANVYYDHGKATTNGVKIGSEVIENVNSGQMNYGSDLSPSITVTNKEKKESGTEVYDNDYDYVTANQSKETSHQASSTSRQYQLLKPGNLKTSSLWTLQEETESLLESLSPISSPKRHFATVNNAQRVEENRTQAKENVCYYSEIENRNDNSFLHPSISAFRRRKLGSESSDFDESDGNYSSLSTADSYRSSSYGREQTPLSDSDIGVPGDFGVDKLDYSGQTSQSVGQANGSISSFNDFLDGLKDEPLTSDWSNKSLASFSNTELNQQTPINFGNSQDNRLTSFKSSVAFCISAAHQAPAHELSLENNGESIIRPSFQPSNIPISSASFNFKKPFPISPKSARIPPFPIEEDSLSTSSIQDPNDDAHSETSNTHSEASSRLYALDLDLSRMSSCASPTPSDFSDGSFFTCKGTAEIKKGPSVSFEDDYDMLPVPTPRIPNSTSKPLKSALKKPVNVEVNQQQIIKDTAHEIWVKQFDKILDDFNNKTHRLGPNSEVMVLEDPNFTGSTSSQGPNCNGLYKAFTNDESEKKQNNVCPVVEDDNMNTFRFKRFLKKSHTKRSKGRRLVRFLSRLSCVSESVHSPDMSATRKRAKLDDGQAYGTDFMPSPSERVHKPLATSSYSFQQHHIISNNTKDSPTSSNHSLDSCPSRTDSAYSSVSESFSGTSNSPRHSSRLLTNSFSPINNSNDHFYLDSVNSSTSDYSSHGMASETSDPFSPLKSQDMLTALSDVFDQLDMCEGEIDTALLDRLQYGHQAINSNRDS